MRRANYNEAITMLDLKGDYLPVLFPCPEKERDGTAYATAVGGKLTEHPVRVVPIKVMEDAVDPTKRKGFERVFGELPDLWRNVLLDDLQLADALEEGDSKRAHGIIKKHLDEPSDSEIVKTALSDPPAFLASHITSPLEGTRFVVWRDDKTGKLRPGIYCEKARQLVYALLVARLGRPGSYSVCKRCGKVFEKRRAWQPYCSYKCRVAEAMKRYRANRKEREQRAKRSRARSANRRKRT